MIAPLDEPSGKNRTSEAVLPSADAVIDIAILAGSFRPLRPPNSQKCPSGSNRRATGLCSSVAKLCAKRRSVARSDAANFRRPVSDPGRTSESTDAVNTATKARTTRSSRSVKPAVALPYLKAGYYQLTMS